MPRYGAKTYGGHSSGQAVRASRTFDSIMADTDTLPSTAKTATTSGKWGKTSFTSTRGSIITYTAKADSRKRKAEPAPSLDDPFSFDSDDDGPGGGSKKPAAQSAVNNNVDSDEESAYLAKRSWTDALKPLGTNTAGNNAKPISRTYNVHNSSVKPGTVLSVTLKRVPVKSSTQMSIDTFTVKQPDTYTVKQSEPSLVRRVVKQTEPSLVRRVCKTRISSRPRKFFISSSPPDHNYSQLPAPDSDCESVGTASNGGASNADSVEIGSSKRSRIFDIDSDFDIRSDEELESGDPEIIFNSPKKRALEAQKRQALASDEESEKTSTTRSDSPHSMDSNSERGDDPAESQFSKVRPYKRSTSNHSNDKPEDRNSVHSSSQQGRKLLLSKKLSLQDAKRETKMSGKPLVRRLLTSPKKARSTYNPRQWHADNEGQSESSSQETNPSSSQAKPSTTSSNPYKDEFDDEQAVKVKPTLRRTVTWPTKPGHEAVSSVKVSKEHKKLFTVVRNVKEAHECQEHGEAQEFDDDIEYIMDGLYDTQSESVRCLSTLSLVTKCVMPGFRMHLRAHGTIGKILSALHNAPDFPNLSLCTGAMMYMLSRDRLNMDLEKQGLELMLQLLNVDPQHTTHRQSDKEYERIRAKIHKICQTIKTDGTTKHLDIEEISTGNLAMETLLSLTSRRAGDWFKEELRTLGGLDHIVNTMGECIEDLSEFEIEPSESTIDRIQKVERCLRVIENVTYLNTDNQNYLITFNSSLLIRSVGSVLRLCENILPFNAVETDAEDKVNKECPGYSLFSCLLAILRVLLNLTHENSVGSSIVGQQDNLIKTVLTCIMQVPQYVPNEQRFDLQVLSFGLMINMVEHCDGNRQMLIETEVSGSFDATESGSEETTAIEALIQLLMLRLEAAKHNEDEQEKERKQRRHERHQRKAEAAERRKNVDPDETGEWHESEAGLEWVTFKRSQDNSTPTITSNGNDSESDDDDDDLNATQEEDENFTEALHRAGKHMEDSIVAAYISLLIGCIVENNSDLVEQVRECLPDGNFAPMVVMLKKFLGFMNFTMGGSGAKSIRRVIDTLDAC